MPGTYASNMELPFSRSHLDRVVDAGNDENLIAVALTQPSTRVVLVADGLLAIANETQLALASPQEISWLGTGSGIWVLLGVDPTAGATWLAVSLPQCGGGELAEFRDSRRWASLRDIGAELNGRDAGAATCAIALTNWHERNPYCPRCGAETIPVAAGWVRRCTADDSEHYPCTDPAVIVVVTDSNDRLLLGHGAQWPQGRFSLIAGFVDPGESIEAATVREVREETGVECGEVTYLASQPWPFPAAIMLAMSARAKTTAIKVDGVEVTEAMWVDRADLAERIAAGTVTLPMRSSVARVLITQWYGGPLPEAN